MNARVAFTGFRGFFVWYFKVLFTGLAYPHSRRLIRDNPRFRHPPQSLSHCRLSHINRIPVCQSHFPVLWCLCLDRHAWPQEFRRQVQLKFIVLFFVSRNHVFLRNITFCLLHSSTQQNILQQDKLLLYMPNFVDEV